MRHKWRDGYHFGVLCCALTVGTVMLINLVLTVVMGAKTKSFASNAILRDGDCKQTKRLDLWLHLPINILSTLLLGASNYSMQCLSAPTRQDINDAHRQNVWMHVGVPSIRNIFRISWFRRLLWCLLFISSVPLHLLFNSVVFSSTSISQWIGFAVTSDFLAGAPFNTSRLSSDSDDPLASALRLERFWNSTSLVRLENEACLATYGEVIMSGWGDVLFMSTEPSAGDSFITSISRLNVVVDNGGGVAFCDLEPDDVSQSCVAKGTPDPNNWVLRLSGSQSTSHVEISHCMAEKVQEHCQTRSSVLFMIIITTCNLVKLLCMGIIVWKLDSRPLVTIGDAIASFLDSPDVTTAGNCLGNKFHFQETLVWVRRPCQYRRQRHMWFSSASYTRWLLASSLCALTIIAASALFIRGNLNLNPPGPFSLGFGVINVSATFSGVGLHGTILSSILIANSPQLILSFLYFAYNSLWTSMLVAQEWSNYGGERKTLRVTSPVGEQRSTYRLQLPYRYGIPIQIVSGILHWLVSQSIFLVVLDSYNPDGTLDTDAADSKSSCGFSPIAILVTIITGSLVLFIGVGNGFRRYPMNGIPLAASCSAAISAACHPTGGDDEASRKAVMWGACGSDLNEIINMERDSQGQQQKSREPVKVGHCSFTSFAVQKPIVGKFYAGLKK